MNGAARSRPWFKTFASEILASHELRRLTPEQRGFWLYLRCEAWRAEPCGSIPADGALLWQLAGAPSRARFEKTSAPVLSLFRLEGDRYWDDELAELAAEMVGVSMERRVAGKVGANKRWQTNSKPMANAMREAKQGSGDKDKNLEQEKEKEPDRDTDAEARHRAVSVPHNLNGLARAVFATKTMPNMTEEQYEERQRVLKMQAASLMQSQTI